VDSAKLVEAAGRSEMRIAMDTERLGPVELRAHMVGDQVGAAITVEKRDAHSMLAVELPALQQALSDKQIRVEQVTLLHASLGSAAGDAGASQRQDQRSSAHASTTPWPGGSGGFAQTASNIPQSGIFDSKGRLSVHA
jgi:flagellar hook-length control protein FliK